MSTIGRLVSEGVNVMVSASTVGAGVSVAVAVGERVSVGVNVGGGTKRVIVGSPERLGASSSWICVYFESSWENKLKFRLLPQIDLAYKNKPIIDKNARIITIIGQKNGLAKIEEGGERFVKARGLGSCI